MRKWMILSFALLTTGCSKSNSLSGPELDYVRTTLDLARTHASVKKSGIDSISYQSQLAAIYKRHNTSRTDYLKATGDLSNDPTRAQIVYDAIRDSLGVK